MEPERAKIRVMQRKPWRREGRVVLRGEGEGEGRRKRVRVRNWKRKRSCQNVPQKPVYM